MKNESDIITARIGPSRWLAWRKGMNPLHDSVGEGPTEDLAIRRLWDLEEW